MSEKNEQIDDLYYLDWCKVIIEKHKPIGGSMYTDCLAYLNARIESIKYEMEKEQMNTKEKCIFPVCTDYAYKDKLCKKHNKVSEFINLFCDT